PPQRRAHHHHHAGARFFRVRARRGRAVVYRGRRGPVNEQLRHHDQCGAARDGARPDGVVVARRGVRLHAGPGAGREPAGGRRARRLRPARQGGGPGAAGGAERMTSMDGTRALLDVRGLKTRLEAGEAVVRAVDGVDIELRRGECFALVGESGSGKSMTALSITRLLPDSGRIEAGEVLLEGQDLLALPEVAMRAVRGRRVAMIFQEPGTALNPVLTAGRQVV